MSRQVREEHFAVCFLGVRLSSYYYPKKLGLLIISVLMVRYLVNELRRVSEAMAASGP